jgi:lipid-A-disaccharide synthase|tara:strand:- start:18400 stop:19599 length:1200 start_codon:yes stop_codon:yes gene_type:complete
VLQSDSLDTETVETDKPVIFALLAGEISGDNLGVDLIRGLKSRFPAARFVGVGGPAMISEGMESWFDISRLSVNGFVDPLKRLPDLIHILREMKRKTIESGALCFIGIDFNFFNLLLEGMLKKQGVKTVHYVSPTVWAWRKGRIKSIAKKVDLMLTLYPFELDIYRENGIDAEFVGHPKAYEYDPLDGITGMPAAQEKYGVSHASHVVAILPGSRSGEVTHTGPDFLRAAIIVAEALPDAMFIIAAANEKRKQQIEQLIELEVGSQNTALKVNVVTGDAKVVMQAADLVLVNSGTATLEAMLLRKPMVMSYRLGKITYAIISRLVTTDYFALPNILSQKPLVPEYIQDAATPEVLADAMMALLKQPNNELTAAFDEIHQGLRKNSGEVAAQAIAKLIVR